MDLDILHRYPLIRILLPLLGGIILADHYGHFFSATELLIAVSSLLILLYLLQYLYIKPRYQWGMGLLVSLIFFLMGIWRVGCVERVTEDEFIPAYHTGVVTKSPIPKEKSVQYTISLDDAEKQTILLYVQKDSLRNLFDVGDVLSFYGRIYQPDPPVFSDEFDYATYLRHKHVGGTIYVKREDVHKLGCMKINLQSSLQHYRDLLYNKYVGLGIRGNNLALISALTLGVKDEFSTELKNSYSMAGVSHVLALSGLHVGLLFVLLTAIFRLVFLKTKYAKQIALLIAVILLWLFALFVGASPSIVRSVSLFSLLGIAQLFRRERTSLNTLAFVAVVMLIYDPYWLFDIGFILSFSAVASILLFYPLLKDVFQPKNKVVRYFWEIICVSFVAQLGTLPWIIYYFHAIPIYFLLANILVIPLITMLLYILLFFILTLWIPQVSLWISYLLVFLSNFLNNAVEWISNLPFAAIREVYIYRSELIVFLFALGVIYYLFSHRGARGLQLLLLTVLLLILTHEFEVYTHRPIDSFRLVRSAGFEYVECSDSNGILYLLSPDEKVNLDRQISHNLARWKLSQIDSVCIVKENSDFDALFWENGVLSYRGIELMFASKQSFRNVETSTKLLSIDYLYVDGIELYQLKTLIKQFDFGTIIIPKLTNDKDNETVIELCKENNLNFITLSNKAYVEFL